jgi:hypothetical protein
MPMVDVAIARRIGAVSIGGGVWSGRRSLVPTCSGEPGGLSGAMLIDVAGTLIVSAAPPLFAASCHAGSVATVTAFGAFSI